MTTLSSVQRISRLTLRALCAALLFVIASCESDPDGPEVAELNPDSVALAGGVLTQTYGISSKILTKYPPALFGQVILDQHLEGAGIFDQTFVPPSAPQYYGLGPIYAATGCFRCHVSGGRGRALETGEAPESMMLKISRAGSIAPDTVPGFGVVIQPRSIFGRQREGAIKVTYDLINRQYADGESYQLRSPRYRVDQALDSPRFPLLPQTTLLSARIAPPLIGMGLLEYIPEADLIASADPGDANSDGISGRVNMVNNAMTLSQSVGRFGWKASIATAYEHAAHDFNQGMGVTSTLGIYARESCLGQPQAFGATFDDPEIQGDALLMLSVFLKTTAVPGRRNMNSEQVRRGQKLFTDIGCAKCHTPQQKTGVVENVPTGLGMLSNQTFFPYTDLLLHDMGDGLADNRPEWGADGREWRTPPLWGIGLSLLINGNLNFLHDGRARTLEEAILWHGGEAENAKDKFVTLPKSDRDALIAFIRSL